MFPCISMTVVRSGFNPLFVGIEQLEMELEIELPPNPLSTHYDFEATLEAIAPLIIAAISSAS